MLQAKMPPHSMEAEQSVLGGLLIDTEAWTHVCDVLSAADFYLEDHRLLFSAIARLAEANKPVDMVTAIAELRERDELDRVTAQYVGRLATDVPSAANIRAYADTVRDNAVMRGLIAAGTDIVQMGYVRDGKTPAERLDAAEAKLSALSNAQAAGTVHTAEEAVADAVTQMQAAFESDGEVTGQTSGYADLDRLTGGFQAGDLIYLAARPGMGKTIAGVQFALTPAMAGQAALLFSMEMGKGQIARRAASALSGVAHEKMKLPKRLDDDGWEAATRCYAELSRSALLIDDTPALRLSDIRARARRAHRRTPLSLVVIDYLQLMQADHAVAGNRNAELEPISRGLKQLARELACPVVCLAQLNRNVEHRRDRHPMLSDLKDCGGTEQDADVVLFLYRDDYYNEDSPHAGVTELIVGKQRNGPLGLVELSTDLERVRFRPYFGPVRAARDKQSRAEKRASGGFEY